MREQTTKLHTGRRKYVFLILIPALLAFACLMYLLHRPEPSKGAEGYTPPPFETQAKTGVPEPEERYGYSDISAENGISFSIVGTMYQQEDSSVVLFFTNPETSESNMLCEICDESGKVIYRSGVLRPGEYIERLTPLESIENVAMKIELNVYAFEPETWYSKGTVSLSNMLQPW